MFQLHKSYTRQEIHDVVGGSLQSYLPNKGGQICCACLNTDFDPDAPHVILPGTGKGIEYAAKLLVSQDEPIPTFIKRKVNEWEYVGMFRVERFSKDFREIRKYARESNRTDITMVIYMAPAEQDLTGLAIPGGCQ